LSDKNIQIIESAFGVSIYSDKLTLEIRGSSAGISKARKVISKLVDIIESGEEIQEQKIKYLISMVEEDNRIEEYDKLSSDVIITTSYGKPVKCKTLGQKKYVEAIKHNSIVFGVGPAGTGKTYLSVALAVLAYKSKLVEKIILTRPAVEAGEKLGFLPGDLSEKIDPYLRPLFDALGEMFGLENYQKLIERGVIEVAPLAYMRGRTLNNAFIILDEAQNTTTEQMKMFLTRLGENSKMVINGDVTQIDLPGGRLSGLKHATHILTDIKGIEIVNLTYKDVVRHQLVTEIIKAYGKENENEK